MGQVTIYLEKDLEQKVRAAAKEANLSLSKWIAQLLAHKFHTEWPESVIALAGAWGDMPDLDEIRASLGADIPRETL